MFDPYRKWLGILPKDQPPHYYRLLGVETFEGDLDVIEGAVERQMGFIRQYQSGDHAAAAAKILNELALARLCLLKPATKSAYDTKLREQLAPLEPDVPDLKFSVDEPTAKPTLQKMAKKGATKSTGIPLPMTIGSGIAIVVVAIVTGILFSGPKRPPANQASHLSHTSEKQAEHAKKSGAKSSIAHETDKSVASLPTQAKPSSPSPTTTPSANAAMWQDSTLTTEAADDPIELLKLIDLNRDVLVGEWVNSKTLAAPYLGRLYLPVTPPDDYQIEFAARRLDGDDGMVVGFVMSGRPGMISVDGWNSKFTGLYVDGREAKNNSTTRPGKLLTNKTLSRVVLTIHPGHLHVAVDGKEVINWHGDPHRLTIDPWYKMPAREQPFIALLTSKFEFESITLTPVKRQKVAAGLDRLDRIVDVSSMIDADRDKHVGDWSIDKTNTLRSSAGRHLFYLPTVVPKEYTLSMIAELPSAGTYALTIGLVAGQSYFQFTSTDHETGLDQIDGIRWNGNETRLGGTLLKPGMPVRIDCTVTEKGIRVEGNGRLLVDWRGDFRRLSMPDDWALPDARRLSIGTVNPVKFREIKLGPPQDAPKRSLHPPVTVGKPLDLIASIEPVRDALEGTWEREGTALLCRGDGVTNKLAIPVEVPDEYKLTMKVTRLDGGNRNNELLILGVPSGDSKAYVNIDGGGSSSSGIGLDSAKAKWMGTVIPGNSTREIVTTVRKTGIKVTSDGATILGWAGNPANFHGNCYYATPGRSIMIGSWNQRFRFEKLELEALPPDKSLPDVPKLGADGDLLAIIDPIRDARRGDWAIEGNGLTCTGGSKIQRLRIPADVPERYVLTGTVERTQGVSDLMIGLVVGGRPCSISVDGGEGTSAGIDMLDGVVFYNALNMTHRKYKGLLFPKGQQVKVRCAVTTDSIVVSCGDKEVVRWHGDARRLSARPEFDPPNPIDSDRTSLWLGSYSSDFVLRDLQLSSMSDIEAEWIANSFSGTFPTISQLNTPLATVSKFPMPEATSTTLGPKTIPSPSKEQMGKPGEWIDLLEWAEGFDCALRGIDWNDNLVGLPSRKGIKFKPLENARFPIPAIIDGGYEMEVEFTRQQGDSDVVVIFPIGIHAVRMQLSAEKGAVSQFAFVDGKTGDEHRPGSFSNNIPHRIFIRVQHDGDKAGFAVDFDDAKDYFKWEGSYVTLMNVDTSPWKISTIRRAWIGSWKNDLVFQKLRVRMLSGTIRKDVVTAADREQDLKKGYVRLIGETAIASSVGTDKLVVNQIPLGFDIAEREWPMITPEFKYCTDFYFAHAPSRLKCPIPPGAKSFSVVGFNSGSRSTKYKLSFDGKQVYDSGEVGVAVISLDIPAKSTLMELVIDPLEDNICDHTFWCFPRFHSMAADRVTDKMIDSKSGTLKFAFASSEAEGGGLTHNQVFEPLKFGPIHYRDAQPCDEFICAHAPSSVTYKVPQGMTRFTAIGYNVLSHSVKYEVWADSKRIYESPTAGIVSIDVKLPPGTKIIELKIDELGKVNYDHSFWCYPRLTRK